MPADSNWWVVVVVAVLVVTVGVGISVKIFHLECRECARNCYEFVFLQEAGSKGKVKGKSLEASSITVNIASSSATTGGGDAEVHYDQPYSAGGSSSAEATTEATTADPAGERV